MSLIQTKAGLAAESDLDRTIHTFDEDAALTIAVEWKRKDSGELMRRDVWVTAKRGLEMSPKGGAPG